MEAAPVEPAVVAGAATENGGLWGGFITEIYGSVVSAITSAVVHIVGFLF